MRNFSCLKTRYKFIVPCDPYKNKKSTVTSIKTYIDQRDNLVASHPGKQMNPGKKNIFRGNINQLRSFLKKI